MMKIVLTVIFYISTSLFSFGQDNIELIDFRPSECFMEPNLELVQKRIVSQNIVKDTLIIEVVTRLSCELSQVGEVEMNRDTLKLVSDEKPFMPDTFFILETGDTLWEEKEAVDCDCYFHFEFVIAGISELPRVVSLNNEIIQLACNKYLPPSYGSYYGDSLIMTDSDGYYYSYKFYDSCKIKVMRKTKGEHWKIIRYYENGIIRKESEFFGDFDKVIESTYDEKGNVLEYINTMEKN